MIECNLEITRHEAIVHAVQQKLMDKVAQKKGVIMVQDIYIKITKREETKIKKAKKVLK